MKYRGFRFSLLAVLIVLLGAFAGSAAAQAPVSLSNLDPGSVPGAGAPIYQLPFGNVVDFQTLSPDTAITQVSFALKVDVGGDLTVALIDSAGSVLFSRTVSIPALTWGTFVMPFSEPVLLKEAGQYQLQISANAAASWGLLQGDQYRPVGNGLTYLRSVVGGIYAPSDSGDHFEFSIEGFIQPSRGNAPIQDGRVNNADPAAPVAVYCPAGLPVVYGIDADGRGYFAFALTEEQIASVGVPSTNTLIAQGADIQLWRLTSGEFQVVSPPDSEGKVYNLIFSQCAPGAGNSGS